jgi:hypothetical protein
MVGYIKKEKFQIGKQQQNVHQCERGKGRGEEPAATIKAGEHQKCWRASSQGEKGNARHDSTSDHDI